MKILNLYSGIGGNRELWEEAEITAVELVPEIADIYKELFPNDKMIIGDAHEYWIKNYNNFDFIWASPPCPTHSRARFWGYHKDRPVYPDLTLYQEILFLNHHFDGLWCVENVVPYYKPLIEGKQIGRHLFWTNFRIGTFEHKSKDIRALSGTSKRDKLERNKVDPEIGLHIMNCARNIKIKKLDSQLELFGTD